MNWYLVDSGKHLDWKGSTSYQTQFNSAVSTWNNYKSGVIRKDAWNTINDVTISDYNEVSSTAGVTSSAGTIKFNTYQMDNFTSAQKRNVCTHELFYPQLGVKTLLDGGRRRTKNLYGVFKRTVPAGQVRQ